MTSADHEAHAAPEYKFCPDCDARLSGGSRTIRHVQPTNGTDSWCVGSAITGVLALSVPLFGLTGLVAIILGFQGRFNIKETRLGGGGLAIFGIILGIVSAGLVLLPFLGLPRIGR